MRLTVLGKCSPDYVLYEFVDSVRDLLLESSSVNESIQVFEKASAFIASRVGQSFDFQGLLLDPAAVEDVPVFGSLRPFASVATRLLRRLGGVFTERAERLEQRMGLGWKSGEASLTPERHISQESYITFRSSLHGVFQAPPLPAHFVSRRR